MSVNRNVTVPPGRVTALPYKGEPARERDEPVPPATCRGNACGADNERSCRLCRLDRRRRAAVNRLQQETSPYLLQHADTPVEWYPWGEEALAKARAEDKPILLSVGYAACHWCHVMAHESFEDAITAALMNERFVNVKVDREERPDVDGVYMDAVVAMTGHGGWPLTVFLTPAGEPFLGGTYFPP